jgi:hypothetical protein
VYGAVLTLFCAWCAGLTVPAGEGERGEDRVAEV